MSYILDALKRAEAQRERGKVPSLNSQPMSVPGDDDEPLPAATARPLVWAAGGAAVVVLGGVVAWYVAGDRSEPARETARAPAIEATPAPATQVAATPIAAAPPPAPPATMTAPAPAVAMPAPGTSNAAPTPGVALAPAPVPTMPPVTAPPPAARVVPPMARTAPASPTPNAGTAAPTAAASTDDNLPMAAQLPPDVRRELPNLSVGGSIYSDDPRSRFIIVNGQVLHEGDAITPGLVLEKIRLKSAVLRYKSTRFLMAY